MLLIVATYFGLALTGALLLSRGVVGCSSLAARIVTVGVSATALAIIPVQAIALLQIFGVIRVVNVSEAWICEIALFITALLFAIASPLRSDEQRNSWGQLAFRLNKHVSIAAAIAGLTYFLFFVRAAVGFPEGYDALAYHYPVALRWLQQGTLAITGKTAWQFSLPGNLEILQMLVLSTGLDKALAIICLPFTALILFNVWILCRRLLYCSRTAVAVVVMVATIPVVCYQTFSGYVDLFGTSMLLSSFSLLYCTRHLETGRAGNVIVSGVACGIAAGTKPTFLPLCGGLFLAFVLWETRNRRCRLFRHVCK